MRNEKESKSKYTAPSLVKIGDIGIKTLGSNQWEWDHNSNSSCQNEGAKPDDSCHQMYYS